MGAQTSWTTSLAVINISSVSIVSPYCCQWLPLLGAGIFFGPPDGIHGRLLGNFIERFHLFLSFPFCLLHCKVSFVFFLLLVLNQLNIWSLTQQNSRVSLLHRNWEDEGSFLVCTNRRCAAFDGILYKNRGSSLCYRQLLLMTTQKLFTCLFRSFLFCWMGGWTAEVGFLKLNVPFLVQPVLFNILNSCCLLFIYLNN